jgi:Putative DNA-binding domain
MATFFERYLKKARPEDITYSDLDAFLQQGIEEHQNLEYKPRGMLVRQDNSIIKSTNRWDVVGFSVLAKVVAGFANAEGGLLVLGVEELEERYDGVVIKKRPGAIKPLPISVTREQIENQLLAKIKPPVEGITIIPIYPDETHVIYLIEVPLSIRIPHRVDELFYYQRINFSIVELQHFQIADLFGKRFAPDLEITLKWGGGTVERFIVHPIIHNKGRAVAKYVLCTFTLDHGPYTITEAARGWGNHNGVWEYHAGVNMVVYPDRPLDTDHLYFQFRNPGTEGKPLTFHFGLYAEDMVGKEMTLTFDPRNHSS